MADCWRLGWVVIFSGIAMLTFALLMSARMGIFQEMLYKQYGKHPKEALFYNVRLFSSQIFYSKCQMVYMLTNMEACVCVFVALSSSAWFPAFLHRHLQLLHPLQSEQ